MESYFENWKEKCVILKESKLNDDIDIKKGMICIVHDDNDSCLLRVCTLYENNSVSLWPFELCKINGYPPEKKLIEVLDEYIKSKYCPNIWSQKQHIDECEKILDELSTEFKKNSCPISLEVEVDSALGLIEYYKEHINWKREYPNGECFLICHIGKAILIIENGNLELFTDLPSDRSCYIKHPA